MKNILLALGGLIFISASAQEHGETENAEKHVPTPTIQRFDWSQLSGEQKKAYTSEELPGMDKCVEDICGTASSLVGGGESLKLREIDEPALWREFFPKFQEYYTLLKASELKDIKDYSKYSSYLDGELPLHARSITNLLFILSGTGEWTHFSKSEAKPDGTLDLVIDKAEVAKSLPQKIQDKEGLIKAIEEFWMHPLIKEWLYLESCPFELGFAKLRPGRNYKEYYLEQKKYLDNEKLKLDAFLPKKVVDKFIDTKDLELPDNFDEDDLTGAEMTVQLSKLLVGLLLRPEAFPAISSWKGLTKEHFLDPEHIKTLEKKRDQLEKTDLSNVAKMGLGEKLKVLQSRIEAYTSLGDQSVPPNFTEKIEASLTPDLQAMAHLMNLREALEGAPTKSELEAMARHIDSWAKNAVHALSARLSNETSKSAFTREPIKIWPKTDKELRNLFDKKLKQEIEDEKEPDLELSKEEEQRMAFPAVAMILAHGNMDWGLDSFRRKFRAPGLEDAYFRLGQGGVRISPYVIANPKLGQGVFQHELGHWLDHALQNAPKSQRSREKLDQTALCMKQKHGPFKVDSPRITSLTDTAIHFDHSGCSYHDEDFADYIASIAAPKEGSNFGCLLVRQQDEKFKAGPLYIENDSDPHSPELFRLLQVEWQIKGKIPASCQRVLEDNKIHLDFEDCMPLESK